MTLTELADTLRAGGEAVIYCHPFDLERMEHALTLLPADVRRPRLQAWNGAPVGRAVMEHERSGVGHGG